MQNYDLSCFSLTESKWQGGTPEKVEIHNRYTSPRRWHKYFEVFLLKSGNSKILTYDLQFLCNTPWGTEQDIPHWGRRQQRARHIWGKNKDGPGLGAKHKVYRDHKNPGTAWSDPPLLEGRCCQSTWYKPHYPVSLNSKWLFMNAETEQLPWLNPVDWTGLWCNTLSWWI